MNLSAFTPERGTRKYFTGEAGGKSEIEAMRLFPRTSRAAERTATRIELRLRSLLCCPPRCRTLPPTMRRAPTPSPRHHPRNLPRLRRHPRRLLSTTTPRIVPMSIPIVHGRQHCRALRLHLLHRAELRFPVALEEAQRRGQGGNQQVASAHPSWAVRSRLAYRRN